MALIQHPIADYLLKRTELTRKDDTHFTLFIRLSSYIARYPANLLTPSELRVLLFIFGRTLIWKKRADNVAFRHFLEGVYQGEAQVCGPTGLAKQAVRDAIQGLQDKGYLDIHAFRTGNSEYHWRFYEPKVEKLLADYQTISEVTPLPVTGSPPSRPPGVINSNKENNLSSIEDSATDAPTSRRVARARTSSMAKRIEVDCNEDPNELVKRISGRAQAGQAVRIAKSADGVPKNKWQTNDLQALLDKARANAVEDGFTVPRVLVIAKAIGVLHKRMRDKEVKDPLGVFTWILKHWGTIASANRRSKARQAKETKSVQSEMSMAPNFNDLAYRFPYLIGMYDNRNQEAQEKKSEAAANLERRQTAREVQQTVAEARKELARAQDLRAKQVREEMLEDNVRRVRRTRAQPIADDDDFVFPLHKSERS